MLGLLGLPHLINLHANGVLRGVPDFVVGRIHQDFVENLVETWHEGNVLQHHALTIVDPQLLLLLLGTANVGVWAQEDVLQLRLLLVDVLDRLALLGSRILLAADPQRRRCCLLRRCWLLHARKEGFGAHAVQSRYQLSRTFAFTATGEGL